MICVCDVVLYVSGRFPYIFGGVSVSGVFSQCVLFFLQIMFHFHHTGSELSHEVCRHAHGLRLSTPFLLLRMAWQEYIWGNITATKTSEDVLHLGCAEKRPG